MKTIPISKWVAAVALLFISSLPLFAQVNRTLGTLPPGGAVTITFDVIINTPFPANTSSVTNQGNVTGTGFGPILTDDPATGAASDQTVTAVTVAPQITCPPDITTNGEACLLPSVAFGATVAAGIPAPTLTYKLGATIITSPYVFPVGTNVVSVTATNGTTPNAVCSFKVTVLPGSPPQLNIVQVNTDVVLSWPSAFNCYTLQYTPELLSPPGGNVWFLHPGPFTTNGGSIYLTNGIVATNRFFRLAF
ncbi:MAG: hypothetical protein EXS35_12635 [Pedosphaera sp.]|nr:hypothetical protein [Pedosphaera sp.]